MLKSEYLEVSTEQELYRMPRHSVPILLATAILVVGLAAARPALGQG